MFVKLLVFLGSPFYVGSIDTHSSLVPSYPLHGIVQFVVNKHYVTIINFIASKKMGWCIPIKSMKSHEITQQLGCLFTSHPLPRARKSSTPQRDLPRRTPSPIHGDETGLGPDYQKIGIQAKHIEDLSTPWPMTNLKQAGLIHLLGDHGWVYQSAVRPFGG